MLERKKKSIKENLKVEVSNKSFHRITAKLFLNLLRYQIRQTFP